MSAQSQLRLCSAEISVKFEKLAADLDGVIFDSHQIVMDAYRYLLGELQRGGYQLMIPDDCGEYRSVGVLDPEGLDSAAESVVNHNKGIPSRGVIHKVAPSMGDAKLAEWDRWFSLVEATWPVPPRPMPGARRLTEQFVPGDWAAATACSESLAHHRLMGVGVAAPSHIVNCDTLGQDGVRLNPKPWPDPFAEAYRLLGVPINKTLTLGDSPNDHVSALAAALKAKSPPSFLVGVASSDEIAEGLLVAGAFVTVRDLSALSVRRLGGGVYVAWGRVVSTAKKFAQIDRLPNVSVVDVLQMPRCGGLGAGV